MDTDPTLENLMSILILTVEDAFAVELPEAADFRTVGQLCEFINQCHPVSGFSSRYQTASASNGL